MKKRKEGKKLSLARCTLDMWGNWRKTTTRRHERHSVEKKEKTKIVLREKCWNVGNIFIPHASCFFFLRWYTLPVALLNFFPSEKAVRKRQWAIHGAILRVRSQEGIQNYPIFLISPLWLVLGLAEKREKLCMESRRRSQHGGIILHFRFLFLRLLTRHDTTFCAQMPPLKCSSH